MPQLGTMGDALLDASATLSIRFAVVVLAAVELAALAPSALRDVKIAQVDGDQEQVANGCRLRAPRKRSASGRKPKSAASMMSCPYCAIGAPPAISSR